MREEHDASPFAFAFSSPLVAGGAQQARISSERSFSIVLRSAAQGIIPGQPGALFRDTHLCRIILFKDLNSHPINK
jgi:hypothetical protein